MLIYILVFLKELSELHQLSGESIENYRYIQRENQFLINDNKSLATKVSLCLIWYDTQIE